MSKLDELMDLAETMKDRAGELDYEDGSPSEYYKARAALQDALKDVVEDAERYRWLKENHLQVAPDSWVRTGDDLEEAIDAAMKP